MKTPKQSCGPQGNTLGAHCPQTYLPPLHPGPLQPSAALGQLPGWPSSWVVETGL